MTRPLDFAAVAAFSDEVHTSAPAIVAALDAVERDRADMTAAHEAYRLIHALKGAASMVGLAALGCLLNQSEELLDRAITDQTPPSDDLLTLLRVTASQAVAYVDAALARRPTEAIALGLADVFHTFNGGDASDDSELRALLAGEQQALATGPLGDQPPSPGEPPLDSTAVGDADSDLALGPSEPIPPELAEVFALEAQEHLQVITRLTAYLTNTPNDRDSLLELRRSVHTIKGAAGVVGYKAASRLAHRMEDLLDRLYEGTATLTPESVRLLVAASDTLEDVTTNAADAKTLTTALRGLFTQFDVVVGDAEVATGAPAPPDSLPIVTSQPGIEHRTPMASPIAASVVGSVATPPAAAPAGEPIVPRDGGDAAPERRRGPDRRRSVTDRRGSAQVVRVAFDHLSDLLRLVSELVINRSTFDQHYAALIEQVGEAKLSATRLRRVASKLEADYGVRALGGNLALVAAGSKETPPGGHGFDELEFDRYTDFHLLSRELTETASDISTISTRLDETIGNFESDLTRLGRLTRDVQDKVMEFRMVPLATLASRLDRTVRVTATECGKAADLVLEGETVALDKTLLEEMTDPLLHLIRNAVDHGIEPPSVRRAAGKPERGRITIRAAHESTDVLLTVTDDGAGLDRERIRRTAVDRGYASEAEAATLEADHLFNLIFEPGFSTAERLSEVSGRGVGLDIVRAKVARLGGRIHVASEFGAGTTITVRVPMTLAITRILLVRAGGELLGLPLGAVEHIARLDLGAVAHVGTERAVTIDGRTYPLRDLAATLGLPRASDASSGAQSMLIANLAGRRVALAVDEIVQSRDAVVKTLGTHLRRVSGIWGATLLGDGTVVLILNPTDLAGASDQPRTRVSAGRAAAPAERDTYTVLVVDDSLSMRHVLSNAVKRAGWNPLQARDGVEALDLVQRALAPPDLILLDIEMPRMDGYEFLATIRAQPAYSTVPVVMLTSRGGEKHREKAMALGATDYVVKPFQEEALFQTLSRLIRASRTGQRKAS